MDSRPPRRPASRSGPSPWESSGPRDGGYERDNTSFRGNRGRGGGGGQRGGGGGYRGGGGGQRGGGGQHGGFRGGRSNDYNSFDTSDNSWNKNRRRGAWAGQFQDVDDELTDTMNNLDLDVQGDHDVRFSTGQAANEMSERIRAEKAKEWANIDFSKADKESDKFTAEKWAKYPPIVKIVYKEHPDVTNWPAAEAEHYRKANNDVTVQMPPGLAKTDYELIVPNPVPQFAYSFINYPEIQRLLMSAGFDEPSPIQAQAWPLIMQGFDTIGIAQTGTGKTLAFLLPAYVHILEQEKMPGLVPGANVLIMAPTRELAIQIHKEVVKFNYADVTSVCIYGGADRKKQIAEVRRGCNIIIATPGRLDDLIMAEVIDITTVTFVVLDEADRMLDCGFEPQIRKTMYKIRPDRQTIMTSATWPSGVQRLANSYMHNPVQVIVGTLDLAAVNSVEQSFEFMEGDAEVKLEHLFEFIAEHQSNPDLKVMVFATSKATAAYVSSEIAFRGVSCSSIRGDMEQSEREYAIESIKLGEVQFLVATDVASRGIDIPDLTHVINFDFPRDLEEYVHRVGRTGRAGKFGKALTYFTRRDSKHAVELMKILEKADQQVPDTLHRYAEDHARRQKRLQAEKGENWQSERRGRYNYNF